MFKKKYIISILLVGLLIHTDSAFAFDESESQINLLQIAGCKVEEREFSVSHENDAQFDGDDLGRTGGFKYAYSQTGDCGRLRINLDSEYYTNSYENLGITSDIDYGSREPMNALEKNTLEIIFDFGEVDDFFLSIGVGATQKSSDGYMDEVQDFLHDYSNTDTEWEPVPLEEFRDTETYLVLGIGSQFSKIFSTTNHNIKWQAETRLAIKEGDVRFVTLNHEQSLQFFDYLGIQNSRLIFSLEVNEDIDDSKEENEYAEAFVGVESDIFFKDWVLTPRFSLGAFDGGNLHIIGPRTHEKLVDLRIIVRPRH